MLEARQPLGAGKKVEGMSFLFFMFLLYLFFLYLRPMELFATWLAPLRPMAIIWVIAFVGSLAHALQHRDAAATGKHYGMLMGLWAAVMMSLAWQGRVGDAIGAVSDFSASVLLFFLMTFNLTSMQRLRQACFVILACLVVQAVTGILAYHTGYKSDILVLAQSSGNWDAEVPEDRPPVPALDTSGVYLWRVHGVGFLSDPNDFAQALIMALPMLLWFVRKGAWIRNLIWVGLPGAAMLYAIVLTSSRGAILGVGSLLFLGARSKLGNFKTMVMLGVVAAGAVVGGMMGGRGMSTKERSAEERIEAWVEGFNMLKSSPVFGIGYGNFTDRHYLTAHNSFVLGFAELGFFGYFFWMSLLVLGFICIGRVAKYAPAGSEESLAGNILRSSLVGYITCAWFLSRTYQPVLYCVLALCTAAWVCTCRSPAGKGNLQLAAPLKVFALTVLMMAISMSAVYGFIFMHQLSGGSGE